MSIASLPPKRGVFTRMPLRMLGSVAVAGLVLAGCGSNVPLPLEGGATQPPSPTDAVRPLVQQSLDGSLSTTGYELLIVVREGADVAAVYRAPESGTVYEGLMTFHLDGGTLTRTARYRSTQKIGTGPDTAVYATTGNPDPNNRKLVLSMYHDVIDLRQPDAPGRYIAEGYVQHNPAVSQGRAGIEGLIKSMGPATAPSTRTESVVIADGELVLMVSEIGGGARIADLFRVENGMVAEHWDFTPVL